ncbi:dipeptidase [Paenibacillus xylanilyticus]|uniref:Membrane dipeptidase n=1 Tax=Paenibacillus xylanilyticus TaxID=248903 RepID=A0A7Y6BXH0_9BACL|nr:dipeptidase [Paenibacillus xylanilyticus]NUU76276.1 membrane dipeptidase [Paenibacillus xylanilyticus]
MAEWRVADYHCDALSKMLMQPALSFEDDSALDVNLQRIKEGNVGLQAFAIYLPEVLGKGKFEHIVGQLEVYRKRVERSSGRPSGTHTLLWREQVAQLGQTANPWGLLTLEGVDGLEGNLFYLELCYQMGVRVMGLTWNYANWAADGVLEKRGAGLTERGRELVHLCNRIGMLLDVSHLTEKGFWELAELSERPFIASHSNSYTVCPNVRNLKDDQIRAIIARDGRIGLTFVPWFVKQEGEVRIEHLLPHIEQVCSLGGEHHLMMGSDFDGIPTYIQGLEHPGQYPKLIETLLKHYDEKLVRGWMWNNAMNYLRKNLPEGNLK